MASIPFSQRASLEDNSSWLSFIFMAHLSDLFATGSKRDLREEDLGGISIQDRSDILHEKFCLYFEAEKMKSPKKRSLWIVLLKASGYSKVSLAFLLFGIATAFQFGPVLILNRMVDHFAGTKRVSKAGLWIMVALLFLCPMITAIASSHSNRIMAHVGSQVRNILINVIYRKSLTIAPSKRQSISTGRILTMFSGDTNQMKFFVFFANNTFMAPFQLAVALYLIYQQVQVSMFVGFGYQLFTIPIQSFVMKIANKIRANKMKFTDKRVKLLNEVLNGIRIIKYYGWEAAFLRNLTLTRISEIRLLRIMAYMLQASFGILMFGAPQIQSILIFWTFVSLRNRLDAATVFTCMALFGLMATPFIMIPYGLQLYNQSAVAATRIMDFLCEDDLVFYITSNVSAKDIAIEFDNASLGWAEEEEEEQEDKQGHPAVAGSEGADGYSKVSGETGIELCKQESSPISLNRSIWTLLDVTVQIESGQLVGIIGSVGSGKSSLLSSILGEMHLKRGAIRVAKPCLESIAYCDQRPWIVNATVKGNILFGKDFDSELFEKSLFAASMMDDLKLLPQGVETEIGERGINLSGGQKARVSLARAVYSNAELYLLDDPLSAVDAHVGEHIFQKCVVEALAGKTRLLVTHHAQYLPRCDFVIILGNDGRLVASGKYYDISSDLLQQFGVPVVASNRN